MKCRVRKSIIALGMVMALADGMSITSFAAESDISEAETPAVEYSVDMNDAELVGAIHVLERSAVAQFSEEGSDTVTRTRTISGWITINITASFDWYTEGAFSYVRCSSMSASRSNPDKKIVESRAASKRHIYR